MKQNDKAKEKKTIHLEAQCERFNTTRDTFFEFFKRDILQIETWKRDFTDCAT